jgi:hypothetical protein
VEEKDHETREQWGWKQRNHQKGNILEANRFETTNFGIVTGLTEIKPTWESDQTRTPF